MPLINLQCLTECKCEKITYIERNMDTGKEMH